MTNSATGCDELFDLLHLLDSRLRFDAAGNIDTGRSDDRNSLGDILWRQPSGKDQGRPAAPTIA